MIDLHDHVKYFAEIDQTDHHADVSPSIPPCYQLKTTLGLKLIDNGLGLPVFGAEEAIVDFALLAGDKKATLPSQVQDLLID